MSVVVACQMELDDVSPLKKLRVMVEPKSGTRKSWYLEKVGLLDC